MISHNHSDLYFSCVVLLLMSLKEVALNLTKDSFSFLPTLFPFWFVERHEYTPTSSWLPIRIVHFYFHFVIMAFLLIFNHMINVLIHVLNKLAQDHIGRMSALCLFYMDLIVLGAFCQELGPIFSQFSLWAWLRWFSQKIRAISWQKWSYQKTSWHWYYFEYR